MSKEDGALVLCSIFNYQRRKALSTVMKKVRNTCVNFARNAWPFEFCLVILVAFSLRISQSCTRGSAVKSCCAGKALFAPNFSIVYTGALAAGLLYKHPNPFPVLAVSRKVLPVG